MGEPWPIFDIAVQGFPAFPLTAASRPKAMAEAWRSYLNYDDRIKFGDFMRLASVRRRKEPVPDDGYGYVRRAYGVDPTIGDRVRLVHEGSSNGKLGTVIYPNSTSTAMVHVILDGDDHSVIVHPSNVEFVRP